MRGHTDEEVIDHSQAVTDEFFKQEDREFLKINRAKSKKESPREVTQHPKIAEIKAKRMKSMVVPPPTEIKTYMDQEVKAVQGLREPQNQIQVVVAGTCHSGKSTLCGQISYLLGAAKKPEVA